MSVRLKRFTMDLSPEEYKRLSVAASMMGISKKDLIIISLYDFTHKKLNKKTEATLKTTNFGKNLKKFASLKEMFDDLGI
jgi:hypothetical protein